METSLAVGIVLLVWLALMVAAVWYEDWNSNRRAAEREQLERQIAAQQAELRRRFEARNSELSLGAHEARRALLRASFEAAKKRSQSGQ